MISVHPHDFLFLNIVKLSIIHSKSEKPKTKKPKCSSQPLLSWWFRPSFPPSSPTYVAFTTKESVCVLDYSDLFRYSLLANALVPRRTSSKFSRFHQHAARTPLIAQVIVCQEILLAASMATSAEIATSPLWMHSRHLMYVVSMIHVP